MTIDGEVAGAGRTATAHDNRERFVFVNDRRRAQRAAAEEEARLAARLRLEEALAPYEHAVVLPGAEAVIDLRAADEAPEPSRPGRRARPLVAPRVVATTE